MTVAQSPYFVGKFAEVRAIVVTSLGSDGNGEPGGSEEFPPAGGGPDDVGSDGNVTVGVVVVGAVVDAGSVVGVVVVTGEFFVPAGTVVVVVVYWRQCSRPPRSFADCRCAEATGIDIPSTSARAVATTIPVRSLRLILHPLVRRLGKRRVEARARLEPRRIGRPRRSRRRTTPASGTGSRHRGTAKHERGRSRQVVGLRTVLSG